LWISRVSAAGYRAGPTTGTVEILDLAADHSTGKIGFVDLAPDAETAAPGPMPSPLEEWIRPLGGDPSLATLTGSASWRCEPPPATVPTPGPVVSVEPAAPLPVFPTVTAISGDDRIAGVHGCGWAGTIDGSSFADSCGPSFQAPPDDRIVRLAPDGSLTLEVDDSWTFDRFSYGIVTTDEAVRWRSLEPDTYRAIGTDVAADGRRLTLPAPEPGDWVVKVNWQIVRGDDEVDGIDYFRVVVED
jgi:hypothetical protein